MDLTPDTLRSATFRDKLRGYHPDDVDEFLESVARGLEVLLARLRDATERARAAQPAPPPQADPDEAVRTLSLAQRTADLAVREAKLEAERLVKAAEDKARRIVGTAEETAVHVAEEAQAELRSDLERLQAARDQLFGEVKTLGSWLEGERGRIRRALVDVADRLDNVKEGADAPTPKGVSVPAPPRHKAKERTASRPTAREATPPRGQPRTPPAAAPAPRQPTPPEGQPAVKAEEKPLDLPRFEPAPKPEAQAARPVERPAPPAPPTASNDDSVFRQARAVPAPAAASDALDDDPYFAELRRAMNDKTPLGPREDDWGAADAGIRPPQHGTGS